MQLKNVVITGASKGIGAETAKILAMHGFNIIINYNNSLDHAVAIKESILAHGGKAEICKGDVGNYCEANNLMDFCVQKYGSIDILINNAGISQTKLFTDISMNDWNEMVRINLTGVFNSTQSAVKHMVWNRKGKIINISSIWGITGASCEVHYSTVKAGVIGFTKSLAKELAANNIQVNCVAPGIIKTEMLSSLSEDELKNLAEETPLKRLGSSQDIANAIHFLCTEKSNFITGQVISPNGGYLI